MVIVNWNSGEWLSKLVESLLPLSEKLKEIIVVDNASTDRSMEFVPQRSPFERILLAENCGFAAAVNRGLQSATADFVLLLNPDIELPPHSVERLYAGLRSHPRAAIGCGPLLDRTGEPQRSFQFRPFPTFFSVLTDALLIDEIVNLLPRFLMGKSAAGLPQPAGCEALDIEQPAAAYWLLRKEAWQEIGGFDERFFPAWFEDVDFCRRLHNAGRQILLFPDCPAFHRGGYSLEHLGYGNFLKIYYGNLLLYLQKHHPHWHRWLRYPVLLGIWMRMGARQVFRR